MLKKTLIILGVLLLVFLVLSYGSLWSRPENPKLSYINNEQDLSKLTFKHGDSVNITASTLYEGNGLKNLMQGEHYRKTWEARVTVEVIFLDSLMGGMKFIEEGGGKQTKSLEIEAPNGVIYTLRSVNKDPEALVPEYAKALGIENLIIDGISAQHPYGALPAARLAEKAGVLHTHPKLVFVPRQDWLKDLNDTYGNKLYLLEFESEGDINWTTLKNVTKIIDTEDLIELKNDKKEEVFIDEAALVRARLLDIFIGDWDRHAKQWGWAMQKRGDSLVGVPVAADRDNAFFTIDGILPSLLSNKTIEPKLRPFEKEIDYLPGLMYDFDTYFLKDVPESVFVEQAYYLQNIFTDEILKEALMAWPQSVYELDGEEVFAKLKSRRKDLIDYAKNLKRILDEKPRLSKPLNGLDDLDVPESLLRCFNCGR